jgi:hypothetical protein
MAPPYSHRPHRAGPVTRPTPDSTTVFDQTRRTNVGGCVEVCIFHLDLRYRRGPGLSDACLAYSGGLLEPPRSNFEPLGRNPLLLPTTKPPQNEVYVVAIVTSYMTDLRPDYHGILQTLSSYLVPIALEQAATASLAADLFISVLRLPPLLFHQPLRFRFLCHDTDTRFKLGMCCKGWYGSCAE